MEQKKTGLFRKLVQIVAVMAAVFVLFPVSGHADSRSEGIAAVVGPDAISVSDVSARIRLVIVSSGMPDTQDIRNRLALQIINVLIEEQIKIQEAKRLELDITQQDIDEGFAAVAAQNNFKAEQFLAILNQEKIPYRTLENQIRSQIAWSRVIQSKLRPQVEVTEVDVQNRRDQLLSNAGKTEYLVSEIFLPVEKPAEENNVKKLSERLVGQLVKGEAPFTRVAAQFSQSAAAARGGDLGWVQEDQLDDNVSEQLGRMKEGDLSKPVRSLAGYHILYLRNKRTISAENIPSLEDIGTQIGLEQLERLQRRYLLDLKSTAFIEYRV